MKIVWSDSAVRDLESIRDYYEQYNSQIAERYCGKIIETADVLATNPKAGRERGDLGNNIRSLVVDKYYMLVYEVIDDTVQIYVVWDVRREPSLLVSHFNQ